MYTHSIPTSLVRTDRLDSLPLLHFSNEITAKSTRSCFYVFYCCFAVVGSYLFVSLMILSIDRRSQISARVVKSTFVCDVEEWASKQR